LKFANNFSVSKASTTRVTPISLISAQILSPMAAAALAKTRALANSKFPFDLLQNDVSVLREVNYLARIVLKMPV
jgi:hypothetical protein